MNIAKKILQEICTRLGYKYDKRDFTFDMLTHTRYTNIEEIDYIYVRDQIRGDIYRISCEKINFMDAPEEIKEEYRRQYNRDSPFFADEYTDEHFY